MARMLRGACGLALALVVWACANAAAQTKAGDSIGSLGLGLGQPISGLNLARYGGGSEAPGSGGVAISPQFIRQLDPHLGLGGELTYQGFSDKAAPRDARPDLTVGGSLLTVELVARYLVTPEKTFSPYLIGGLGLSDFSAHVKSGSSTLIDTNAMGLALSAGGGAQASLTESLLAMGELRWHLGTSDSEKFGTGAVNALAVLLRLGWKF